MEPGGAREWDRTARGWFSQCGEGRWSGDAVNGQAGPPLEASERLLGVDAEAAVEGCGREAVPGEEELEGGDVPTCGTAGQRATAEQVLAVTAEGAAGARVGDTGRVEPRADLKALHGRASYGTGEPVDRPRVEAARLKRDL
jgi:hypothetical protein